MKNYIYTVLLLFGCANVMVPTGGEKDTTPPKILEADPKNFTTTFQKNEIILKFDEFIQLKNVDNIKFLPHCEPKPKMNTKGKVLKIEIPCSLSPETTYSLNFGKSIVDVNEQNEMKNFQYIFSTGRNIDSLFINGTVKNPYVNTLEEGVLVGLTKPELYPEPYYYTYSNKEGEFRLDNIKHDDYILFAVMDQNNNLKIDPNEYTSIAKEVDLFNQTIPINLFSPILSFPIKEVIQKNKQNVIFKHEVLKHPINILNIQGYWYCEDTESEFWFLENPGSLIYEYNSSTDSITLNNSTLNSKPELKLLSEPHDIIINNKLIIKSSSPIESVFKNKFEFGTTRKNINVEQLSPFLIQITILDSSTKEQVIIAEGGVIDIFQNTNDSTFFNLDLKKSNYGTLKLSCTTQQKNLIIELFEKDEIIRKVELKDSTTIDWLSPGLYNLRLFSDKNENKYWDGPNLDNKTTFEKITIHPSPIEIRPNWEISLNLDSIVDQ